MSGYCFADRAWHGRVTVVENVLLARDTYRVRVTCPVVARRIVPGQFVMLKLPGHDPLLGRPLALYDVFDADGQPAGLDLVYYAIGRMTRRLARAAPGAELDLWGPLGNGFPPRRVAHLVMVAGGIGQTPFVALAREFLRGRTYGESPRDAHAAKVTLCYGARSADLLAGVSDFQAAGARVLLSTDDGSQGHHGLVTDLLARVLGESPVNDDVHVVCCGPEKMMHAVAALTQRAGVSCEVSLETPMACGIGICFSCVAKIRDDVRPRGNPAHASSEHQGSAPAAPLDRGWDYRRTCVEGPVFDARQVVF